MENGNSFFVYLSAIEGLLIVCMLGWEIFWLRRMYYILGQMPTAKQLNEMVDMLRGDRESIRGVLISITNVFESARGLLSSGMFSTLLSSMGMGMGTEHTAPKSERHMKKVD